MRKLKRIYIEVQCDCQNDEVGEWCEDDMWSGEECLDCGKEIPQALVYKLCEEVEQETTG